MVGEEDANAGEEMVTDEIEKLVEFKEKGYVGWWPHLWVWMGKAT